MRRTCKCKGPGVRGPGANVLERAWAPQQGGCQVTSGGREGRGRGCPGLDARPGRGVVKAKEAQTALHLGKAQGAWGLVCKMPGAGGVAERWVTKGTDGQ